MRTSSAWTWLGLAALLLLSGCGEDGPGPEASPRGADQADISEDTEAAASLASLLADIPSTKTAAPIKLQVHGSGDLGLWRTDGKGEMGWWRFTVFVSRHPPESRFDALRAVLRSEASRRGREANGSSEAVLELTVARDAPYVSLFWMIFGAAADPAVRITHVRFRASDEDDGVTLKLAQGTPRPPSGKRAATVFADIKCGAKGEPDVVFLRGVREHTFTVGAGASVAKIRKDLATAWKVWRGHYGANITVNPSDDPARGADGYRFVVSPARSSERPSRAWSVVRLLQAAKALGLRSIEVASPAIRDLGRASARRKRRAEAR